MDYKLLLGSHVGMSGPSYFAGAVQSAIDMKQDGFMFYTGAPQNTKRKDTSELKIKEGLELMKANNIDINNVVIHAPYIVNLANTENENTIQLAREFLRKEIDRAIEFGVKNIVLHPGSRLKATLEEGVAKIAEHLNAILKEEDDVVICLETMAGKGSEVGRSLEEIKMIIDQVNLKDKIGVCLDTCHVHDAGYDIVNDFDGFIDKFNKLVGIKYLKVVHINDSKNECGAGKDRHENIGYGFIGFDAIIKICYHPMLNGIIKVLETPYVEDKPPYKEEIENIRLKEMKNKLKG